MDSPDREVKKIAVLRANAVGDFIVTLPALEALRNSFPRAEIVLFGRHWHALFLAGRPGPVDRTVVIPYSRGIYDPPPGKTGDADGLKRFLERMTEERFDLAFQLHGGGKHSNPFVAGLQPGLSIGARTPDAVPLDRWLPYRLFQNEALRLLEIVSLAGAQPRFLEPRLQLTAQDFQEADNAVSDDGRPLVVINPGSRDHRRRWPAKKFAALADALARRGANVVVNGDAGDAPALEETLNCMRTSGQSACGTLSLRGLAGLLSRASLLVSNDSGPFHLALAVGTPAVGIYWCGNVPTYGPIRSRRTAVHISWRMHCPVCGAHCMEKSCPHSESFVADIGLEPVLSSALELYREDRCAA